MRVFADRRQRKDNKGKRWGRKFDDNRNWPAYNEELVVRGEFLLDCEFVEQWEKELAAMNRGKRGSPFLFPESLIRLQAVWAQWIDYRGVEGVTRKLAAAGALPAFNDYTTAWRRVTALATEFALPTSGSVCAVSDTSGMHLVAGGTHRERLYGKKRRRYIRVTITADPVKKKLLACEVAVEGEGQSEPEIAQQHMEQLMAQGIAIEQFGGDGSYDTNSIFNFLELHGIGSAVKIRSNAVPDPELSPRRAQEIECYQRDGYKKWAKKKKYGHRWPGTEGIFSAVKRKFGETTRATRLFNACQEAKRKFWVYEEMKRYAAAG